MASDQAIVCPGCQSRIAADGRTLIERSAHLQEVEDAEPIVEKLTTEVETLRKRLAEKKSAAPPPAQKGRKRKWTVPKGEKKHEVELEPKKEPPQPKPGRKSWW